MASSQSPTERLLETGPSWRDVCGEDLQVGIMSTANANAKREERERGHGDDDGDVDGGSFTPDR